MYVLSLHQKKENGKQTTHSNIEMINNDKRTLSADIRRLHTNPRMSNRIDWDRISAQSKKCKKNPTTAQSSNRCKSCEIDLEAL
jgi:hypothetical protein